MNIFVKQSLNKKSPKTTKAKQLNFSFSNIEKQCIFFDFAISKSFIAFAQKEKSAPALGALNL